MPGKYMILSFSSESKIKNRFYGMVRKITKLLNEGIKGLKSKQVKKINQNSISRILKYSPNDWEGDSYLKEKCESIFTDDI